MNPRRLNRSRILRGHPQQRRDNAALSAITHDIKSPLASAQTITELLLGGDAGPLNQDQADLLRRVHTSVRHVIRLANNLLDSARLNAGRLDLTPLPTDLRRLLDDAVEVEGTAAELKQVHLLVEHSAALPIIECDPVHLERVITNLLDNAIKYTPVGGRVTLRSRADARCVYVSVSDTGCGIDVEEIPQLFHAFERPMSGRFVAGSGLGLVIVKAIVEAHGGKIDVHSAVGAGTTVDLELPLVARLAPHHRRDHAGTPLLNRGLADVAS